MLRIDSLHVLLWVEKDHETSCEVNELKIRFHYLLLVVSERSQLLAPFRQATELKSPLHIFAPEAIHPVELCLDFLNNTAFLAVARQHYLQSRTLTSWVVEPVSHNQTQRGLQKRSEVLAFLVVNQVSGGSAFEALFWSLAFRSSRGSRRSVREVRDVEVGVAMSEEDQVALFESFLSDRVRRLDSKVVAEVSDLLALTHPSEKLVEGDSDAVWKRRSDHFS